MLTDIPQDKIKSYAQKYKMSAIDAYRDLLSQAMLDKIDFGDVAGLKEVCRELVKQLVGNGSKDVPKKLAAVIPSFNEPDKPIVDYGPVYRNGV